MKRVPTTRRFNHSGVGSSSTINKSFGLGTAPCKVLDRKHGSWLLEKLNELRLNGDMTDITFAFNGKKIRANQVILASLSPILCELFRDRENFLNAEILPPDCLKEAIDFIYSASIEVTLPGLMRLEQAAQILQMPKVYKMCRSALQNVSREINVHVQRIEPIIRKSSANLSHNSQKSLSNESHSSDSFEETESTIRPTAISNERNSIKMTFHSTATSKDDLSPGEISDLSRIATISKKKRHNNSLENITEGAKKEPARRPRSGSDITSMSYKFPYPLIKQTLIQSPIRESRSKKCSNDKSDEKPIKKTPICQDTFRLAFKSKVLPGFLKGLNGLREEGLFCDLVFIVENTKIPCHRAVIAASSTVFESILRRIKIREIILKKVEDTSLLELVKFIYSGQCTIEKENVTATMRAANRFRLHYVANHCASYLERNAANSSFFLSVDNVLITYKLTNVYGCPKFQDECYKFIISKFWEVVKVSDFYDLSLNELNRIVTNEGLTHSRIHCNDFDIKLFNVLSDWLKYKPIERIPHMTSSVLKFVNFQNIEMSVLKNVISKDGLAMSDEETHQRVSTAMLRQFNASQKRLSSSKYGVYEPMSDQEHSNSLLTWSIDGHPFTFTTSFNTETSRWEEAKTTPVKLLNYAVTSHQGALFVSGGSDPTMRTKCASSEVHMLSNGKWSKLPDMRVMRYNHAFTYYNDNLVAIGGIGNDRDSVTSIEVLDIAKWKSDPKTKWKVNKLSLPTPNHNHYATPIQFKALPCKDNKPDKFSIPSPKFKISFGQRFGASSTTFQDGVISPGRSSSLRLKKALTTVSNSSEKHNSSCNLIFLLMGGECCPRQNLQCDLSCGKLVVKSPLPQDCFHPYAMICNSSIFVIPNDSTEFSDDLLQYSPSDDVWTKLYNPFAVDISSMCSCLINFPRKASAADKIVSKICGYEKNSNLHVMVIQERNAAVFEYDSELATWSTPVITDLELPIDPESGGVLVHWYTYFTA